ncbi:putative quinol monooxygenase [Peribacillus sp. SCS-155]|uniref:putative quinol monooxygenase n=1 Tax=Peribacillus sedimenti TaxID=3115297 RepID=UPI0039064F52
MSKIALLGKYLVNEGERDVMVNILLKAAESIKNQHDCQCFLVNISEDELDTVYVYEVWRNEQAHREYLTKESTQALIKRAQPIIRGIERINTLNLKGGKGTSDSSHFSNWC